MPSPNNPSSAEDRVRVEPGDRLPLTPTHLLEAGLDVELTSRFRIGDDILASSSRHLRGDEGNDMPPIDGHGVLNLHADLDIGEHATVNVKKDNVLDDHYAAFGVFGEAGNVLGASFDNNRFLGLGAPRATWLGIDLSF